MKNVLTVIFILLLFIIIKKYDSMQAMNHDMVERCMIDIAINPDLVCD